MTELEQLCQKIDDNPKDLYLWSILGDYLEEQGDPRSPGVRWLIVEGKYPEYFAGQSAKWTWWCESFTDPISTYFPMKHSLPKEIFSLLKRKNVYACFKDLSDAILCAAEKFSIIGVNGNGRTTINH